VKADASLAIIFPQLGKNNCLVRKKIFPNWEKTDGLYSLLLSCGENLNATIVKHDVSPYHTVYQFLNRA
jgi:hypothetical protein